MSDKNVFSNQFVISGLRLNFWWLANSWIHLTFDHYGRCSEHITARGRCLYLSKCTFHPTPTNHMRCAGTRAVVPHPKNFFFFSQLFDFSVPLYQVISWCGLEAIMKNNLTSQHEHTALSSMVYQEGENTRVPQSKNPSSNYCCYIKHLLWSR